MKFLIYGLNYFPELVGIGKYTGEMAEALVQRGHQVSVITAPPYYPAWKVRQGYRANRYAVEETTNLKVVRCPLWVPKKVSGLRRTLHLLSFALSSVPVVANQASQRPDLIFTVAPAIAAAPAAAIIGKLKGITTWLHIQDFELDAAIELGMIGEGSHAWLVRLARQIEKTIYLGFGRVSSISPSMVERLKSKGVPATKCVCFPNWVDLEQIRPKESANAYRPALGLGPESVVALYSGSMGAKQGLEVIAAAAAEMAGEPQVQFVLCGEGPARQGLQNATRGLGNVHFLPLQPAERLCELLNLADVHLLPQRAGAADLVMPSKLLGIMASGKPVIAGCLKGTALFEIVNEIGICVEPENSPAFTEGIRALAGNSGKRRELGLKGRAYAQEHFSKDKVIDQFLEYAEMCTSR